MEMTGLNSFIENLSHISVAERFYTACIVKVGLSDLCILWPSNNNAAGGNLLLVSHTHNRALGSL